MKSKVIYTTTKQKPTWQQNFQEADRTTGQIRARTDTGQTEEEDQDVCS